MHMLEGRTNWNFQHTARLCISLCMQKDILVHITLILLLILLSTSVHRSGYWRALICESLCKYMWLQWKKSLEDLSKCIYFWQCYNFEVTDRSIVTAFLEAGCLLFPLLKQNIIWVQEALQWTQQFPILVTFCLILFCCRMVRSNQAWTMRVIWSENDIAVYQEGPLLMDTVWDIIEEAFKDTFVKINASLM